MKKIVITSLTVLFSGLMDQPAPQDYHNPYANAEADNVVGIWKTTDPDGKIEIYQSEGQYFGKIMESESMYEEDGETFTKDVENPDESLRDRPIKNLVIMTGFKYEDEEWTGGEIYDPVSGRTYRGRMRIKDGDLHIRGYIGVSLFGRTEVWERVE